METRGRIRNRFFRLTGAAVFAALLPLGFAPVSAAHAARPPVSCEEALASDLAEVRRDLNRAFLGNAPDALVNEVLGEIKEGKLKLKREKIDMISISPFGVEQVLGPLDRTIAHRIGALHRVSAILVAIPGKEHGSWDYALQEYYAERAEDRGLFVFGGHVTSGQEYRSTALREIVEELDLPEGHALQGSLIPIGEEGQFESRPWNFNNLEKISLYVYYASDAEGALIRKQAALLNSRLLSSTEAGYRKWLKKKQTSRSGTPTGRGESWAIHILSEEELQATLSSRKLGTLKVDPDLVYLWETPSGLKSALR